MKPINRIESTALPLKRSDVDTDQIIPSEWLKRVERSGFGKGLFGEWRDDPSFVLNDPAFSKSHILVAGPNFGTGSSREHAVWALMDYGFEAIISSRFGDIFRNNSTKAGLVPVVVSQALIERIWEAIDADSNLLIAVDIDKRVVEIPALAVVEPFLLDDFTRYRFLEGLDDIGLSLRHGDLISEFEDTRISWMTSTL
ncbi:MAG: 3-isopropylmalate dehydratase small subunit [Acidimicrobiaceae bacterium]|nr:3-isopropylmalate dehydratase small subunit [Acidimicrobiaceae bacterium]